MTVFEAVSAEELKVILENAYSRVEFADGRFAHIAGMQVTVDVAEVGQVIDETTDEVTTEGSRVRSVVLDDGTVIVADGAVVAGAPSVSLATIDFLARGGDQYPFTGDFTVLGVSYQQALANYVVESLGGLISAQQYPEGGTGRLVVENTPAS